MYFPYFVQSGIKIENRNTANTIRTTFVKAYITFCVCKRTVMNFQDFWNMRLIQNSARGIFEISEQTLVSWSFRKGRDIYVDSVNE